MDQEYLPADLRTRLTDLMKENNVTQGELAAFLDVSDSSLSRFFSGQTDKFPSTHIIRLARRFQVSSDFLLGIVDEPDRKNYDVSELGLSVQSAKNLYTGKVNAEVVSRLLESDHFANVTYMIERYCNGDLAESFAAQNALYTTIAKLLKKTVPTVEGVKAASTVDQLRQPVYLADVTTIQNTFMSAVKEIKKDYALDFSAVKNMTAEKTEEIFKNLTRNQDMQSPNVTPAQLADAVASSVSALDGMDSEKLETVRDMMLKLIQSFQASDGKNAEK